MARLIMRRAAEKQKGEAGAAGDYKQATPPGFEPGLSPLSHPNRTQHPAFYNKSLSSGAFQDVGNAKTRPTTRPAGNDSGPSPRTGQKFPSPPLAAT